MQSDEVMQLISDLKEVRNSDNAPVIDRAISSIRYLKEETKIMTGAYIDCATRLQSSALEKSRLEEKLNSSENNEHQISPLSFRKNSQGFILQEDWNLIIDSCKVIGNAIYAYPGCGMTEDGNDYLPADILRDPEEIMKALEVVNGYFRLNGATRSEMIEFIKANPDVKITHILFDKSEYIYSKEDGNIYDENGYLFEDWYGNRDGIRMRNGGKWDTGWRRVY